MIDFTYGIESNELYARIPKKKTAKFVQKIEEMLEEVYNFV